MNWQPIESAPTDTTEVLVTDGGHVWTAQFGDDQWEYSQFGEVEEGDYLPTQPTHWMFLPQPPNGTN